MTDKQRLALRLLLKRLTKPLQFHHGDCKGADEEAAEIALGLGIYVISHPSNTEPRAHTRSHEEWDIDKPLERNRDIVNASDILIAAPSSLKEQLRSGTWATIRYARHMCLPTIILDP
ncbi:MAG TPA: hypothetical protein VIY48_06745 [Candidatus Paceibacterota bacterium]